MSTENIYPDIPFQTPYGTNKPSLLIKESDKIPYHLNSSGGYETFDKPDKNGKPANEIAVYAAVKYKEATPLEIQQKYKNKYYYIPMNFSDYGKAVENDLIGNSRYALSHWFSFQLRSDGSIAYPNGDGACDPVLQYSKNPSCSSGPVNQAENQGKWFCNNVYDKRYGYIITNSFHEKNVSNLSLEGYAILYELCNAKNEFRIKQLKCTNPAMKGCLENMNTNFFIIGRVPALRSEFINMHLDNYKSTESKSVSDNLSSIMNYAICKNIQNQKLPMGPNTKANKWSLIDIHNDIMWCMENKKFDNVSFTNLSNNNTSSNYDFAHYARYAKAALTAVQTENDRFAFTAIPKEIYYNKLNDINKSTSELILLDLNDGKGFRNVTSLKEILESIYELSKYSLVIDEKNSVSSISKLYIQEFPRVSRPSYNILKNAIQERTIPKQKIQINNLTIPKSADIYPNFLEIIMKNNSSKAIEIFYKFIKQTNQYECTNSFLSNINLTGVKNSYNLNGIQNLDKDYIYSCKSYSLLQFNKVCNLLIKKDFKNAKIEFMKIFGNEKNKICYDYIINSGFGFNLLEYIVENYFKVKTQYNPGNFISAINKNYRFFPDEDSLTNLNKTSIDGNSNFQILYKLISDSKFIDYRIYEKLSSSELTNTTDKLPEISSIKYYESFINKIANDNISNFTIAKRYNCVNSINNKRINKKINFKYPICIKNSKTNEFNIYTDYYLNGMRTEIYRNLCYVNHSKDKKFNESDLPEKRISQAAMVRFYYYWYKINRDKLIENLNNFLNSLNLSNDYFSINFSISPLLNPTIPKDKFILNGDPFTTKSQKVEVVRQRIRSFGNVPTNINRSILYSLVE